jgi:hypothetical protein
MVSFRMRTAGQLSRATANATVVVAIAVFLASSGVSVLAQNIGTPAVFSPPQPTNVDQIRAIIEVPGLCSPFDPSTVVVGNTIRTTLRLGNCIIGPPPFPSQYDVVFGPVTANTYTYEVYFIYNTAPELQSRQQLVVTQSLAAVPALSIRALLLLVVALAAVAAASFRAG